MALKWLERYHIRADEDTGQRVLCTGDPNGDWTVLEPLLQNIQVVGSNGDLADVIAGALCVREYVPLRQAMQLTVTATSSTLATLGLQVDPAAQRLRLIPSASGIYWSKLGAASATTMPLNCALELDGPADLFKAFNFYAATNTGLAVLVEG